jgi:DNA (cytosine-5)-methyltransferase 1
LSRKKLTTIDLFAGCGGLSLGLEQAGFRTLAFSELNKDASATFRLNRAEDVDAFGAVAELQHDAVVRKLKAKYRADGVQRVDLVCGGPPCQGYSGIGHRRTHRVEREEIPSNHLYLDMIDVIRRFQPRMFLFENVRGLMTGRWTADGTPGEIWDDVRAAFENIGDYEVQHALVQAKQYGVPQNRPRVLIVGIHKDQRWVRSSDPREVAGGLLPRPSGNAPDLCDVLDDLVDSHYLGKAATTEYPRAASSEFQHEMRSAKRGLAERGAPVTEHEYSQHSAKVREKFEYMLENNGEIPESMRTKKFAQRVLPRRWDPEVGPTITATSLADDFVHYKQPRTLTVREWARLQCFPDWYQFSGPRTTGGVRRAGDPSKGIWDREVPKYTQIGNAVPVRLARAIGEHLRELLR